MDTTKKKIERESLAINVIELLSFINISSIIINMKLIEHITRIQANIVRIRGKREEKKTPKKHKFLGVEREENKRERHMKKFRIRARDRVE